MQIWRANPIHSAPPRWNGGQLLLFSEVAERVELCLFDETGKEAVSVSPRSMVPLARYLPHVEPGQALRFRVHGRGRPPRKASGATRRSFCSIRTARRSRRCRVDEASSPLFDNPEGPPTIATARRSCPGPRGQPVLRLGQRAPARVLSRKRSSMSSRQGLHRPTPEIPKTCAARTPGWAIRRHRVPREARGHGAGAHAVHQFVHDRNTRGLRNYWGYIHRVSGAAQRYARAGQQSGIQADGQRRFTAGIEVILDVVYNHTGEGKPDGRCYASRASTTRPTIASPTMPLTTRLHGTATP